MVMAIGYEQATEDKPDILVEEVGMTRNRMGYAISVRNPGYFPGSDQKEHNVVAEVHPPLARGLPIRVFLFDESGVVKKTSEIKPSPGINVNEITLELASVLATQNSLEAELE